MRQNLAFKENHTTKEGKSLSLKERFASKFSKDKSTIQTADIISKTKKKYHSHEVIEPQRNNIRSTSNTISTNTLTPENLTENTPHKANIEEERSYTYTPKPRKRDDEDQTLIATGEVEDRTHEIEQGFLGKKERTLHSTQGSALRNALNIKPINLHQKKIQRDLNTIPISHENKDISTLLKYAQNPERFLKTIMISSIFLGAAILGIFFLTLTLNPLIGIVVGAFLGYASTANLTRLIKKPFFNKKQPLTAKNAFKLHKKINSLCHKIGVDTPKAIYLIKGYEISYHEDILSIGHLCFEAMDHESFMGLLIMALTHAKTHRNTPSESIIKSINIIKKCKAKLETSNLLKLFFTKKIIQLEDELTFIFEEALHGAELRNDVISSRYYQPAYLTKALITKALLEKFSIKFQDFEERPFADYLVTINDNEVDKVLKQIFLPNTSENVFLSRLQKLDMSADLPSFPPKQAAATFYLNDELLHKFFSTKKITKTAKKEKKLKNSAQKRKHSFSLTKTDILDKAMLNIKTHPKKAVKTLKNLCKQYPYWAAPHTHLGVALLSIGKETGIQALLHASECDPNIAAFAHEIISETIQSNETLNPSPFEKAALKDLSRMANHCIDERNNVSIEALSALPFDNEANYYALTDLIASLPYIEQAWIMRQQCQHFNEIDHNVIIIEAPHLSDEEAIHFADRLSQRLFMLRGSNAIIVNKKQSSADLDALLQTITPLIG